MRKGIIILMLLPNFWANAQPNGLDSFKKNVIDFYIRENKWWVEDNGSYKGTKIEFFIDSLFLMYDFDSLAFLKVGVSNISHKPEMILAGNKYTGQIFAMTDLQSFSSAIEKHLANSPNLTKAIFYVLLINKTPVINSFYQLPINQQAELKEFSCCIDATTAAFSACLVSCKMKRKEKKQMLIRDSSAIFISLFVQNGSEIKRFSLSFKNGILVKSVITKLPIPTG